VQGGPRAVEAWLASRLVDAQARAFYHRGVAGRGHPDNRLETSAQGELAVPVQMELSRIIISDNNDQQIIYLKEVDGDRAFPIVIGFFEATSIDRRIRRQSTPRPLTHDLLASTIESLGGELQDIYISELRDHTYFAKLRIKHEGELIEVDSRPSDAIAVAVTVDVPIFVSEEVIDEAGQQ
jgi:bifunctional DNase/RNase